MKVLPLLFVLIFSQFLAKTQNFYVIKVEGEIKADTVFLQTGHKISTESVIHFSAKTDKLYLLSPSDGYFLLSPENSGNNEREWVVSLKNAIIPNNKYYKTATRGTPAQFSEFNDVYDLMAFFRNKVLIIENDSFSYNSSNILFDKNNFFVFTPANGNNKIKFHYNEKNFFISGNFTGATLEMEYHQNNKKTQIGEFYLQFASRKQLANEIAVFFGNRSSDVTSQIYLHEVVPFIQEVYGNTKLETVKEIIKQELKIELMVRE